MRGNISFSVLWRYAPNANWLGRSYSDFILLILFYWLSEYYAGHTGRSIWVSFHCHSFKNVSAEKEIVRLSNKRSGQDIHSWINSDDFL
jgi:hypothetical protein